MTSPKVKLEGDIWIARVEGGAELSGHRGDGVFQPCQGASWLKFTDTFGQEVQDFGMIGGSRLSCCQYGRVWSVYK